jgi:pSer/pThr/pTyr-binding forkhead associated (FHA) protein
MALALRFISGKYQGGEFALEEGRDVFVGRSSELDMVLVEEMVSRKHARMKLHGGRLEIEDLGSTNGTFVNGEKITKTTVGRGDRVLIGSNILRVVSTSSDQALGARAGSGKSDAGASLRKAVRRPGGETSSESRMSGELQEIPLPDLLQLFGTSKKDGVLIVDTGKAIGRIILKAGLIHSAEISTPAGEQLPLPPEKAVYRILSWEEGFFELDPPSTKSYEHPLDLSAQAVLMEAFRQKDELAQMQARLPARDAKLHLSVPLVPKLGALDAHELDVLQVAINEGSFGATLEACPDPDLETARIMLKLVQAGYLAMTDK